VKRMDRALANNNLRNSFPKSYHNPILLRYDGLPLFVKERPFCFEVAWTTHDDYHEIVSNAWRSNDRDVLRGLDTVREEPVIFNKMKFGNIFRRKRRLEAPLNGVQRRCTPFFHTLTMVIRKRNRVKR
jgi:hypothetical protein